MTPMKKTYWEKGGFTGKCDLCHEDILVKKSRRKFRSFSTREGDDADDECLVTLCEDCFLKTR